MASPLWLERSLGPAGKVSRSRLHWACRTGRATAPIWQQWDSIEDFKQREWQSLVAVLERPPCWKWTWSRQDMWCRYYCNKAFKKQCRFGQSWWGQEVAAFDLRFGTVTSTPSLMLFLPPKMPFPISLELLFILQNPVVHCPLQCFPRITSQTVPPRPLSIYSFSCHKGAILFYNSPVYISTFPVKQSISWAGLGLGEGKWGGPSGCDLGGSASFD